MAMGLTLPVATVQVAAVSELKLTARVLEAVAVSVIAGSPTDLSVRAVKVMGCGCRGRGGRAGHERCQDDGGTGQAKPTGVKVHQKPPRVTGSRSEPS
jgi:hypothetical protein